MRIYLSPSVQQFNFDVDGVSEATTMNYIADAIVPYLNANGIAFTRNRLTQTLSEIIAESNGGSYDLHLAIHSNAAPPALSGTVRGPRMYHYATSASGLKLANILAHHFAEIYPDPNLVKVFGDTTLAELRLTRAPAVIAEVAFHDNVEDSRWIKSNITVIARELARSVAEYAGLPLIPVCEWGMTPANQSAFNGFTYANVCNVTSVLNMRVDPSSTAPIINRLQNGTMVLVTGAIENGWVPIRINTQNGFVSQNFLCICNTPQFFEGMRLGRVATNGGNLNIRQSPSTTATVIASAPNNAPLLVIASEGNFYKVNFRGNIGYAWKEYITV